MDGLVFPQKSHQHDCAGCKIADACSQSHAKGSPLKQCYIQYIHPHIENDHYCDSVIGTSGIIVKGKKDHQYA